VLVVLECLGSEVDAVDVCAEDLCILLFKVNRFSGIMFQPLRLPSCAEEPRSIGKRIIVY
jgi:hypothetical protein